MRIEIEQYMLAWNTNKNTGHIKIKPKQGGEQQLNIEDPSAFTAAAMILQHESPIYYDERHGLIYSGAEPVED